MIGRFLMKINPSCKLVSLILLTLGLAFVHNPVISLVVFAICFLLLLTSGASVKRVLFLMIPILILSYGAFMTGYRFSVNSELPTRLEQIGLGNADSKVWNGWIFASRVLVYAIIGYLFAFTTDRVQMIRSFQKQLRMPQLFAYGLLAAWGIFPHMMQEYRRTKAAFRARGMRVFPFSPALLRPLLVKSVRWSEALSIAMESRGFSGSAKRSEFEPVRMKTGDWIFGAVCGVLLPAGLVILHLRGL